MPATRPMNEVPHPSSRLLGLSTCLPGRVDRDRTVAVTGCLGSEGPEREDKHRAVSCKPANGVLGELASPRSTAAFACLPGCARKGAAMAWDPATWPRDVDLVFGQAWWTARYSRCVMESQLKDPARRS